MKRTRWVALAAFAFALLPLLLRHLPLLDEFERWTYDLRMRWMAARESRVADIAVVVIDDETIHRYRGVAGLEDMWWPFQRRVYQAVLGYLAQHGARAVVFDVDFRERFRDDEEDLLWFAGSLAESRSVLAILLTEQQPSRLTEQPSRGRPTYDLPQYVPELQPLFDSATLCGFANARVDPDGKVRRSQLVATVNGRFIPCLALAGAMVAFPDRALRVEDDAILLGNARLPIDQNGDFLIRFHRQQDFARYSFGALYAATLEAGAPGKPRIEIDWVEAPLTGVEFQDKIVVIGSNALALMDLKPTALDDVYPGVFAHASLLNDVLTGGRMRLASPASGIVIAGILGALMAVAVLWRRLGRVARPIALLAPSLAFTAVAFHLFAERGLVLALALPLTSAALAYALSYTGAYLIEDRRSRAITGLFQHYVPPAVVKTLVENPACVNLQGERRLVTVFFSDIAGFTEISNRDAFRNDPTRLTAHLNAYLTSVTEVLHRHGATLDKYIGDAVVAFFNAPLLQSDHAGAACRAALDCQSIIAAFNERARAAGLPEFRTRIGLCTGPATVGNVGSRLRYNYTAIGQTVNLGARLEACNKIYGTSILAGEQTVTLAGDGLVAREIDYVRVPGIVEGAEPLRLFEVLAVQGEIDADRLGRRERFVAALALYRRREFGVARGVFEDLSREGDGVSAIYAARCVEFERAPPSGELVHEIHSK